MATFEPGTYRIVNLARNKAIRVPDEYPDTIASWHTQDDANQKWVVERAGGGYCFKSSVHGRYISVNGTQCDSRAYHGQSPTTWKIVPHTPSGYFIQLEVADRVLDLHDRGEVYLWPKGGGEPQKIWNFEKLDDDANDEVNQKPKAPSDQVVDEKPSPALPAKVPAKENEGVSEQVALKEKVIADQNRQLSEQTKQLEDLRQQVEVRDLELAQAHRDIEALSSQEYNKPHDLRETKQAKASSSILVESEEGWVEENGDSGEVIALREEVKRLEDLLAQVFDPEHEPSASNNVA